MSFAKSIPASKALASASTAPKGAIIFLLRAASTRPSSSLISTPIPTAPCEENTALSTLTLNNGAGGGVHELLSSSDGHGTLSDSVAAVYSTRYVAAHLIISFTFFCFPPFLTSFQLHQRAQAIVTICASLSSSTLSIITNCQRKLKNDPQSSLPIGTITFEHAQVSLAF